MWYDQSKLLKNSGDREGEEKRKKTESTVSQDKALVVGQ